MNRRRLSVLLGLGAALLLALALLVPFAGASSTRLTSGMMSGGTPSLGRTMMPTPMPSPSSSMMPTPTPSPSPTSGSGSWCGGGLWDGSGATWGGTGMWGTAFGASWLRDHPAAVDAWLKLRSDNMTEMRTWFDKYRSDLGSPAAQTDLRTLWQDHWNDMKAFYQQYADGTTWVSPALTMWGGGMMGGGMMWGTGYGTGWLMKHPAGFAAWQTLRAKQMSDVHGWWMKHRAQPSGAAAQLALTTMRAHHKAQDLTYMRQRHISSGSAWSYRGWMGMGGTWGGFGW